MYNPLILTIMAIIARHKRLARSRSQLYAQALEVLCYAWDYRRGLALPADSPLADLQPEDTMLMLRRIAWRMQESETGLRANAIGEAELKEILVSFFEQDWRFLPPKARRAASEMVSLLQERNWVLTTRGPDLYGFVHRTFLEYLCALELTERFKAQDLSLEELRDDHVLPRADDDSYREVIRLLCGQLPVRAADQLIFAICPEPKVPTQAYQRLLLAWQSLGELDPRALANATSACNAALLSLYLWLREFSWPHHRAMILEAINTIEPGSWPTAALNREAIRFVYTSPINREPIYRALAKAIWLPNEDLRNRLFTLTRSSDRFKRQGAISVLGWELSSDQRVLPLVRKHAEEDDSEDVRSTAVQVLAGNFCDQAETFDLVRNHVEEDASEHVRSAAIRALVLSFADRVGTFDLVRRRAEEDISQRVRSTAVQVLVESFADRAGTFDLVRRRAEEDVNEDVRSTAVQVLAESFADRVETFDLVRRRAEEDVSETVRRGSTLRWAKRLDSLLSRRLLTQNLNDRSPGIDPREVIDSARIEKATHQLDESPESIRGYYESLVRDHGFPLRLAWLEDGAERSPRRTLVDPPTG